MNHSVKSLALTWLVRGLISCAALSCGGCLTGRAIRDQSQIDPLLLDDGVKSLPQTLVPRCSLIYWLKRAGDAAKEPAGYPVQGKQQGDADHEHCQAHRSFLAHGKETTHTKALPQLARDPIERRNQAQAELMLISDLDCKFYQSGIFGTQAGFNLGAGLAASALSGAASLLDGRSAQNLAAASAFMGTTRATINGEVYFNYVAPAVISEIDALRIDGRRRLRAKRHCTLTNYPAAQAINDALNYHETCSFISGLTSLLKKAGVQQRTGDPIQAKNAEQLKKQIDKVAAEIAAIKVQIATAPDPTKSALLAQKQATLSGLVQINWYVGDASEPAVNYSTSSFTGQIAIAGRVLANAQAAHDAEADQGKKAALKVKLDFAKAQLLSIEQARLRGELLPFEIEVLERKIASVAEGSALSTKWQAELVAKRAELAEISGSGYATSGSWIQEGCG